MFAIICLLLALSALALIGLIDKRVYAGFDSAPEDTVERLVAFAALPALLLFVVFKLVLRDPDWSFGDLKHYLLWAFSSDAA